MLREQGIKLLVFDLTDANDNEDEGGRGALEIAVEQLLGAFARGNARGQVGFDDVVEAFEYARIAMPGVYEELLAEFNAHEDDEDDDGPDDDGGGEPMAHQGFIQDDPFDPKLKKAA